MKVLLIDIDSKIPNLALKKIEKYHKDKGDIVTWNNPLDRLISDKVYVSCIFPENKRKCRDWEGFAEIGGTGYDIQKKLPIEIEMVKPKINWGFTTRGCIRKCDFCFVPEKEGKIHIVGDVYDIWDGKSKEIYIIDNNILALPEHFKKICSQIRKENIRVDFNQGLDHRLLTDDLCKELMSLRHIQEIRFAFDDIVYKPTVLKALEILKKNGLRDWGSRWYVYINPKDTFETVYERMILLKEHKQGVYVMRDRKIAKQPQWMAIACWGNMMGAFKMPLKEILEKSKRMKGYKKYFGKLLLLLLFFFLLTVNAYAGEYSNSQIANAIYKVENSKRYPYGVVSINTRGDEAYARRICLNTIRNQRRRHKAHKCGLSYLECLQRRYAPRKAHPLNRHWLRLVKYFLEK